MRTDVVQAPRRTIVTPWRAFALSVFGLGTQIVSYRLATSSSATELTQALYFLGLLAEVLPLSFVIAGRGTTRATRFASGVILAELLLVSRWLVQPSCFASFDDLLHLTSLWQLVDNRRFLTPNPMLPVGPYYPGLELLTAGVHWATGLPAVPSQLLVLVLARGALIGALYLAFERVAHSSHVAGVAVVLYMANPEFYSFDAQYAYETLALAWAALSAHYVLRTVDDVAQLAPKVSGRHHRVTSRATANDRYRHLPPTNVTTIETGSRRRAIRSGAAAMAALALLAITHHATSWLVLLGLVVLWTWVRFRVGDRAAARTIAFFAGWDAVIVCLWTLIVGRRLWSYFWPLVRQAAASLADVVVGGGQRDAALARPAVGGITPWERAITLASLAVWVTLILISVFSRQARVSRGNSRVLGLVGIAALGYLVTAATRISPASGEFGYRAAAMASVPVACTVALWWCRSQAFVRTRGVAAALGLALLMIGGVMFGTNSYSRLPGPYLVEADQRSIPGATIQAADWARQHLPAGTRIAADRDNSAAMAAVGHLTPVTEASGSMNVGPIYFSHRITARTTTDIREGRIRLILVDSRLTHGLPYEGVYFEPGETGSKRQGNAPLRLTSRELDKFANWSRADLIYRNGPLSIFDVSDVLHRLPVPVRATPAPTDDLDETSWWRLCVALALSCAFCLSRFRSRRIRCTDGPHRAVNVAMGTALGAVGIAAVTVTSHVDPRFVGPPLCLVVAVGLLLMRARNS